MKNLMMTILIALALLTGCSTVKVSEYRDLTPIMIPENFSTVR